MNKLLMLCVLMVPATAFGAVNLLIDDMNADGDGNHSATTINPGESFTFDIILEITGQETVAGTTIFLTEDTGAPASPPGHFTITARTVNTSIFNEDVGAGAMVGSPGGDLDPTNNVDLGRFDNTYMGLMGPATDNLMTLAIADMGKIPPPPAPVTYIIYLNPNICVYTDAMFIPYSFDGLGAYEVTIVPEPMSALLLLGAIPFLRRRRS